MKILYIHQYFKTPKEPGGTRSYWIAKKLIEAGYKVTMLTTSTQIEKRVERKTIDGIDVVYLKIPYNQKMSILKRLWVFINFMIKSTLYAFKEKEVNLVIATSTPLTIGFPAIMLKWFKKTPYIFEVRDLWPEVPIQMGGLNNKVLQKLAIGFEKSIYKNAKHIIALSPGMARGVLKYEKKEKVTMIPNMAKTDEFWPREKNWDLCDKLGLKRDSFKLIHFGALGLANGVDRIIESAKLLKDNKNIEFVFIGEGATEEDLKKQCAEYNLKNVFFLGKYAMKETSEIVNLCDVSLVSFKNLPILYTNSPNKLFDSLSAGKPIIVNSAGWTKTMVEEQNCGYFVDPENPNELVEKIQDLMNNKELLESMGRNSRLLAENKYDKKILSEKFVNVVNQKLNV